MKTLTTALLTSIMGFAAFSASAQDSMKRDDSMVEPHMTMQQCKDHMAMARTGDMTRDDAMMRKDAVCADMLKRHGTMKKSGMVDKKMTLQECKDRMAMADRGTTRGDDPMKLKDTQCSDMIRKDGMMK